MSAMTPASPEGLRARRRRQTEHAIHTAAVRLVERHGLSHVTVDMISTEAGISARTFFNYFPTKESALTTGPPPLSEEQRRRFAEGGPEPRAVLDDLLAVLLDRADDDLLPRPEHFRAMIRVVSAHPELAAALHARFDAVEQDVIRAVAQRLGQPESAPLPALITRIALSVLRTGLDQWSTGEGSQDPSPLPSLRHTADLLRTLLPG